MRFETIEEARRQMRLTQRDLCAAAGIHCMTYTKLKHGYGKPNLRTIEKLQADLKGFQKEEQCYE